MKKMVCAQSVAWYPAGRHTLIDHFTGGLIGTLPTEQHGVSGQFYIVDSKNLFFDNFNYDGGGPGERERTIYGHT